MFKPGPPPCHAHLLLLLAPGGLGPPATLTLDFPSLPIPIWAGTRMCKEMATAPPQETLGGVSAHSNRACSPLCLLHTHHLLNNGKRLPLNSQ